MVLVSLVVGTGYSDSIIDGHMTKLSAYAEGFKPFDVYILPREEEDEFTVGRESILNSRELVYGNGTPISPKKAMRQFSDWMTELIRAMGYAQFICSYAAYEWRWVEYYYNKYGPEDKCYMPSGAAVICLDSMLSAYMEMFNATLGVSYSCIIPYGSTTYNRVRLALKDIKEPIYGDASESRHVLYAYNNLVIVLKHVGSQNTHTQEYVLKKMGLRVENVVIEDA